MRVRIKYSKQGLLKFIGHLDMMRCFQKLLRRAGVDVTFSEGYSPQMVMSYAFPLGVGMTSDSEYVDVDLNRAYSSRELVSLLNEAAPEGLHVLDAREVPLGKGNKGMTLVARADYTLSFRPGHEWDSSVQEAFRSWVKQPVIYAVKKSKKGEKEVDIAPFLYEAVISPEPKRVCGIADEEPEFRKGDLFLSLSAGSGTNIRPDLVMDTFVKDRGLLPDPYRFMINRDEVYADLGGERPGSDRFVPLIGLGTTME